MTLANALPRWPYSYHRGIGYNNALQERGNLLQWSKPYMAATTLAGVMTLDNAIAGHPANGVAPTEDAATSSKGDMGPLGPTPAKIWMPDTDCSSCQGRGTFVVLKRGLRMRHACPCIVEAR